MRAIKSEFYTLKGYKIKENKKITEAMEDYIEMIYRKSKKNKITVKDLSIYLNVKPSSVSKMIKRLNNLSLVNFEKYKDISLTKEGTILGNYLMKRHNILKKFFKYINKDDFLLEQVEKIEHFIDYKTVNNINNYLKKI